MFWGLIMEPQKRYSQVVKKPFHISMAAMDVSTSSGEPAQVMCGFDNRKYLLCTLTKEGNVQCPLDLNFDVGTEVSFITNGNAHVHLTGYLVQDDEFLDEEASDEEAQEGELSLGTIDPKAIVTGKRQKTQSNQNGLTGALGKKLAALAATAPPAKKLKTMDMLNDLPDDDEEEDDDFSLTQYMEEEDDDGEDDPILEEEEDDEMGEEEEEDDEEGEEEETDQDDAGELDESGNLELDEDDEDDDEESEDEVKVPTKQNGVTKKGKKGEGENKQKDAKSPKGKHQPQQQQAKSPKKTVAGGVVIEDLCPGSGAPAKNGKMVQVYYEGRLKSNNKVFDASLKGNGFKFRLGRGEVIKGWEVGVAGMRVGGKRRIVCPPAMAYGKKGSPPTIPSNSTLVFDIELRNVN